MGILDNKSRIVDTVITYEGRRQLATGKMKIEYYSFTDGDAFYQSSSYGVADDATRRFYLESPTFLSIDNITPEADDSGLLQGDSRNGNEGIIVKNGKIFSASIYNSSLILTPTSGSDFSSQAQGLVESSVDNFRDLVAIRSVNRLFDDDVFIPSDTEVEFSYTPPPSSDVDLSQVKEIFNDVKFSRSLNFKFLPPIKKIPKTSSPDLAPKQQIFNDLSDSRTYQKEIDYSVVEGGVPTTSNGAYFLGLKNSTKNGLYKQISFEGSDLTRKIALQVFEVNVAGSSALKLDVLDLGEIGPNKERVLYAGKVVRSDDGLDKFLQILTLVFRRE